MVAKCPHCRGSKFVGRGKNRRPCSACNADAIGDKVVGAGQRLADRIRGRRLDVDGRTTTTRDHRLATETVRTRKPPAKKKPAAAKKKAPAKKPAAPATVRGPVCDGCGQGGTLRMTGAGLHHVGACPPASDGGA